jgi:hypothetical protein
VVTSGGDEHSGGDSSNDLAETPPSEIVCVDCGGPAHLLTSPPEDGRWLVGDVVAYRCRDCRDRWDMELAAREEG